MMICLLLISSMFTKHLYAKNNTQKLKRNDSL